MFRSRILSVILAVIALAVAAAPARAADRPAGRLVEVTGTHLYVEDSGPRDAPALLYIHGGPGTGGYDFSLYQGARLSKSLRLIVLDQRGVLRSDPLGTDQKLTLNDLVEDAEALRQALGIRRWSILGHSFGGFPALLYAEAYPASVETVIFENPSFDLASSARCLLGEAAELYRARGDHAAADKALAAARAPTSQKETWAAFTPLTNGLKGDREALYVHGPDKDFFNRLVKASPIPQAAWGNGATHQRRLYEEGRVYEPVTPRLAALSQPALLIHGRYDCVTAPDQVAAFRNTVRRGTLVTFKNSSHFARVEEPEHYAEVVTAFVLRETGGRPRG